MTYQLSDWLPLLGWSVVVGLGVGFGYTVGAAVASTIIGWVKRAP